MKTESKKPRLKILGCDGNAMMILGKAIRVAKDHKMDFESIMKDAMSGDYDHLLRVMMTHFDVC